MDSPHFFATALYCASACPLLPPTLRGDFRLLFVATGIDRRRACRSCLGSARQDPGYFEIPQKLWGSIWACEIRRSTLPVNSAGQLDWPCLRCCWASRRMKLVLLWSGAPELSWIRVTPRVDSKLLPPQLTATPSPFSPLPLVRTPHTPLKLRDKPGDRILHNIHQYSSQARVARELTLRVDRRS